MTAKYTGTLGMIGLGKMGGNMVRRLLGGGHRIVGLDRDAGIPLLDRALDGDRLRGEDWDRLTGFLISRDDWLIRSVDWEASSWDKEDENSDALAWTVICSFPPVASATSFENCTRFSVWKLSAG